MKYLIVQYIGYNRGDANNPNDPNRGTYAARDQIVVVRKKTGKPDAYGQSWRECALGVKQACTLQYMYSDNIEVTIKYESVTVDKKDATISITSRVLTPTAAPTILDCGDNLRFTLELTTDRYASETSWSLAERDDSNNPIVSVAAGMYATSTYMIGPSDFPAFCLKPGTIYIFKMGDTYGDGICCSWGEGSYTGRLDGKEIFTGGVFDREDLKFFDEGGEINPSVSPTRAPSVSPTLFPSVSPTLGPTIEPTTAPSYVLSDSPTIVPSVSPSSGFTTAPTHMLSDHPTPVRSVSPTSSLSNTPSYSPSVSPSKKPTEQPSEEPSSQQSSTPNISPSAAPSESFSGYPSSSPSTFPIKQPSGSPIEPVRKESKIEGEAAPPNPPITNATELEASLISKTNNAISSTFRLLGRSVQEINCSVNAVASSTSCSDKFTQESLNGTSVCYKFKIEISGVEDGTSCDVNSAAEAIVAEMDSGTLLSVIGATTEIVTTLATEFPTDQPSDQPSEHSSDLPTDKRSDQPTQQPSVNPSALSSLLPSIDSSTKPSYLPSNWSSDEPTISPSTLPSYLSSHSPTSSPSNLPSERPTGKPTISPTTLPSYLPSSSPSNPPSKLQSELPSNWSSDEPSVAQTVTPSDSPSGLPSNSPSYAPTFLPSVSPSERVTESPSNELSEIPSDSPSYLPSSVFSDTPSKKTSDEPSDTRSDKPSIASSESPSEFQSSAPSYRPSDAHSDPPSKSLSNPPSYTSSSFPSDAPNKMSSNGPSKSLSNSPSVASSFVPSSSPSERRIVTSVPPSASTPAPTSSCQDDAEYKYKGGKKNCQKIRTLNNVVQFCKKKDTKKEGNPRVSSFCRKTCGLCTSEPTQAPVGAPEVCTDDGEYKWQSSKTKDCSKIGSFTNRVEFCNKVDKKKWPRKPVNYYCPVTCETCPLSALSSESASSSSSSSSSSNIDVWFHPKCQDHQEYTFRKSVKTCSTIRNYSDTKRNVFCLRTDTKKSPKKPVSYYCSETCGLCGTMN